MLRGIIFDLDGTLVDSLPGITDALNLALKDLDLPPHPQENVVHFIGDGALRCAQRALSDDQQDHAPDLLKRFQHHYQSTWKTGTHIFPGFLDLLTELKSLSIKLAVLSNKPHPFTTEIVSDLFGSQFFDPVQGHLENTPQKPDPTGALEIVKNWNLAPSEVAYLGDSVVDLATAQNSGLHPLIVSWGYRGPSDWPMIETMEKLRSQIFKD